ncbi:hypothetical protein D6C92_08342, partial [Aureobasidium pullulans]
MLTCFPDQQTFIGKTQRNPFKFPLGLPCPNLALLYQGRVEFGDVDMSIAGLSSLPTYMIPYNTNADISPAQYQTNQY